MMVVSVLSNPVIPENFLDPITSDIIIKPIKTNCNHIFDKLPLAKWFRKTHHPTCPLCRTIVTSIHYDSEMKKKIQNEFVKLSKANETYFKQIKVFDELLYSKYINLPVLPPPQTDLTSKRFSYQEYLNTDEDMPPYYPFYSTFEQYLMTYPF